MKQCESVFHKNRCIRMEGHTGRHHDRGDISGIAWEDSDGIILAHLYTEFWYRVEISFKDTDDWNVLGTNTHDSMIAAQSYIDRYHSKDDYDYRIVKVTTTTEGVKYA